MLKITSKQADKVHRLVKECCANCDKDGNCILLDDGEAHRCVQLISIYGILLQLFQKCGIAERPRIIRTNPKTKQIKVKKEKCKNEKI